MAKAMERARGILGAYHSAMNELFASYGSFVARYPFVPLILGVILLGGLSIGLVHVKKETDLEKLWVEQNSRVVKERQFFNERFGGTPRVEAVTITSANSTDLQDDKLDLKLSMDAMQAAIKPLFNELKINLTTDGTTYELRENDFCERPLVPQSMKPGNNPLVEHNYISWGIVRLANCSVKAASTLFSFNPAGVGLPDGWGIEWLPCIKLSLADCFKEGGDYDYPLALQQLEQAAGRYSIIDYTVYYNQFSNFCQIELAKTFSALFQGNRVDVTSDFIGQLVAGTVGSAQILFSWGYRWRTSYANMTNSQILGHINAALQIARTADRNPTNAPIESCILNKAPCCMTWFGLHSPVLTALGSVEWDAAGTNITKIGGLRWALNNFHQQHPVWKTYLQEKFNTTLDDSQRNDLTTSWESLMINKLDPLRQHKPNTGFGTSEQYGDLQLEFSMWRSSDDVIADANKTPIWQIICSVVFVSIYCFFAFVNFGDPVHSHTWVAMTGLSVVTFAIVAGFGLTSAFGIKITPLAGSVVPFLALGLGVDDVFVLVNILRNYLEDPKLQGISSQDSGVPEREMRLTVALAGPSVVLTTFSVLASFFISSLNPIPVVRWFCWQMGITATLHTCGMLLIFIPIMSFDARRVKANINDPNLWAFCRIRSKSPNTDSLPSKTQIAGDDFPVDDPSLQEHVGSSPISKAVAKYYAPLFESNVFKIFTVILFAGLLASMTYLGFGKVQRGLKLSDITLKGSYQNTYAIVTEDRFLSYEIYYVTTRVDLPNNQDQILQVYDRLQYNLTQAPIQPWILESSVLGNLYLYANASGEAYPIQPAAKFYPLEQAWSSSLLGILSLPDMYCENKVTKAPMSCFVSSFDPNLTIGATKVSIFADHLGAETDPNLALLRESRKISDNSNSQFGEDLGFMYGYPYLCFRAITCIAVTTFTWLLDLP
ncbi:hypothetical protein O6H91_04G044400 [Diphasiastrum complanatum]|uniref:Uncharacterized protein n=1 Tax=Diphasiastrum complanatum TaxID=34168 RepID=A0ACC2DW77_DIPCM|nr:hypothetical protein O6H91_04G044400 [Diphasiastrum complanatum]